MEISSEMVQNTPEQSLDNEKMLNNLKLIEDLTQKVSDFQILKTQSRIDFLKKLYDFLNAQLDCESIQFIYNDLVKGEEESKANLIQKVLEREEETLESREANTEEAQLYKYFQHKLIDKHIHFINIDPQKGELSFLFAVEKSPILSLIKISSWNLLQESLLKGFFKF